MARQIDSSIEHVAKVLLDLMAFFIAANLAFDLRYHIDWQGLLGQVLNIKDGPAPWAALYQAMPYMLLGIYLVFEVFGLYRPNLRPREEMTLLVKAQLFAFAILFTVTFFYRGFSYSRFAALFFVPLSVFLTLVFRNLFRITKQHLLKKMKVVRERVLVVGSSEVTENLLKRLRDEDNHYELAGVLVGEKQQPADKASFLGTSRQLGKLLTRNEIDRVLLISGALSHEEITKAIEICYRHRVPWGVVPDLYDLLVDRLHMEQMAGITVMGPLGSKIVGLNLVLKRLADLVVAGFLLILLFPVMALVTVLIKLTSKGPVFFAQRRVGRGSMPFKLYKFRSMRVQTRDRRHRALMEQVIKNGKAAGRDNHGVLYKTKHDERITSLGRFIRMFSIDELPQLFNVIKGDMSLVGPRPAIPYEVKHYGDRHLRRLDALPGITGLWQVSGRNRLSFEQMVDLDIHYIENWSVGLDVRIFFKTIAAVLFSRGL